MQSKNYLKSGGMIFSRLIIFALVFIFTFCIFSLKIFAQERSYEYSSINENIEVNKDSTIRVEEYQKFSFSGTYHQGWREIPLKDISEISDISVFDSKNQKELEYSRGKLNKESPSSWGKYTTFKENGKQIIEWYYDASNEEHEWVLRYTVHGSIQFLKNQTRLYWNIFTDYTVPIRSSTVVVKIPSEIDPTQVIFTAYRSDTAKIIETTRINQHTFQFNAPYVGAPLNFDNYNSNFDIFSPGEAFTIDIGWAPGIPPLSSFVRDFINLRFGYIFSFFIFLVAIIIGFTHWLKGKKREKGREVIIPEYEPPQNIPPLFAEIIMKEKASPKGFAATIVSLAVRGYIKINEEKKGEITKFFNKMRTGKNYIFLSLFLCAILGIIFSFQFLFFAILIILFILRIAMTIGKDGYTLELKKPADANLFEFEKEYIQIIFGDRKTFSFKELQRDKMEQREFSKKITEIKEKIFKELDIKINAFANGGIQKEKFMIISIIGALFVMIFGIVLGNKIFTSHTSLQLWITLLSLISASLTLWGFIKFEAELSEKGIEIRQKLLGFKMFLSITEKDRIKNLTPEMFQMYLPYAMIFGVEKQWSKIFEGMHVPPPEWYGATPVMGAVSGSINTAFSPVSFSNSFSSAFTSAFASTGGAGGAGSGGAGGGGGGGGGGAS